MLRLKQSHGGVEPDWKNFLGQLEVSVNVRGGIESLKRQKIKAFGPETARNTVVNVGGSTVAEVYRNRELRSFDLNPTSTISQKVFCMLAIFRSSYSTLSPEMLRFQLSYARSSHAQLAKLSQDH